jgi:hypothetical protein
VTIAFTALVAGVLLVGMLLFAVHKTRPKILKFEVSLTRWLTAKLEIENEPAPERPPGRRKRSGVT